MNSYYVYITTNEYRTVLYIGVTNDLTRRISEHKNASSSQFTGKYNCCILIYYETFQNIRHAIEREKQLKNWKREWKLALIKAENPDLKDLLALE